MNIEALGLDPDEEERRIDQAFATLNRELLPSDDQNKPVDTRVGRLAWNCIFGTDAEPRAARTAKMNMIMHGDGHGGIHFLDDFQRHWPTDEDHTYVDFVRDGTVGNGAERQGNARWRRLTELRAGSAKSVFHFDVQGSVAKSTHAGIPWLRFLRQRLGPRVHFWPFDGWEVPAGRSAIAEVYPALWSRGFARDGRTSDQHDAFSIAAWLAMADRDGSLATFLQPRLSARDRAVAQVEGWILGVAGALDAVGGVTMPEGRGAADSLH